MKEVVPGDSVNSLLSILDVITVSYQFGVATEAGVTTPQPVDWVEEGLPAGLQSLICPGYCLKALEL